MGDLTLRSVHRLGPDGTGRVDLALVNGGDERLAEWRLALTSVVPLHPPPGADVRLALQVSGYHELAPPPGFVLEPGGRLDVAGLVAGLPVRHANDGPVSAFVILADDSTRGVVVEAMTTADPPAGTGRADQPTTRAAVATTTTEELSLLPWPVEIDWHGPRQAPGAVTLDASGDARRAWDAVAGAESRLFGTTSLSGSSAGPLLSDGPGIQRAVTAEAATTPPGGYRLTVDGDVVTVAAGDLDGFRHGWITLAQVLRGGRPERMTVVDGPAYRWRGLHVDVARQFLPVADVERLVDLVAWRKLDRLHLHLTDDEAWRVPIDAYPELTAVGGWRGHGLVIPPLLGSPAAPTGGVYTASEIGAWVRRGHELGVVLVPEVDVPGHSHTALAAVAGLRDPDDTSGATSVQYFVDNALYPGRPDTERFVETVFAELAGMFDSPWLHVGGDEVAPDSWAGSPAVAAFAARRGLSGTESITGAFLADLVATIRRVTGRAVGAWQEAAECGGVRPGDGYVVAWKSAADGLALAEAGHDVVMSAPHAYYLDMAIDDRWESPGTSWAGTASLDDVCAFEPAAGWSVEASRRLLGVQACLWTEHVRSVDTFDELAFPRLDAIAERAWRGGIAGGPRSIERRAAALPRLGPAN